LTCVPQLKHTLQSAPLNSNSDSDARTWTPLGHSGCPTLRTQRHKARCTDWLSVPQRPTCPHRTARCSRCCWLRCWPRTDLARTPCTRPRSPLLRWSTCPARTGCMSLRPLCCSCPPGTGWPRWTGRSWCTSSRECRSRSPHTRPAPLTAG
jgi:hypothetical protein